MVNSTVYAAPPDNPYNEFNINTAEFHFEVNPENFPGEYRVRRGPPPDHDRLYMNSRRYRVANPPAGAGAAAGAAGNAAGDAAAAAPLM